MAKKKYWNIFKIVFKLAFTGLLVFLVFEKINFHEVRSVFLKAGPLHIIAAGVTFFASQVISSSRLLGFLGCIGLHPGFGFNFRLYLLGMFYNVFLPGGIGGDGYKIYLLRKKFGLPTKQILTSLLLDRVSGLWALAFLATMLTFVLPDFPLKKVWPYVFGVGSVAYYLIYQWKFKNFLPGFLPGHGKAILVQGLQLSSIFLLIASQHFIGNFTPYLFCFLVSSLATILPVSIGGLGIREYVIVQLAPIFGMEKPLAVFSTLSFYLISTLIALSGAWFALKSKEFERMPDESTASATEDDTKQPIHLHRQTP